MCNSYIAFKGDVLSRCDEIFRRFSYEDSRQDLYFPDWGSFIDHLRNNYLNFTTTRILLRGIWRDAGWTIICDPEMTDALKQSALELLSRELKTTIAAWIIVPESENFSFSVYDYIQRRHFFASGGEVTANVHSPLPQEQGLNINARISRRDLVQLAAGLGIHLDNLDVGSFTVKQLIYVDPAFSKKAATSRLHESDPHKKPWWKFW